MVAGRNDDWSLRPAVFSSIREQMGCREYGKLMKDYRKEEFAAAMVDWRTREVLNPFLTGMNLVQCKEFSPLSTILSGGEFSVIFPQKSVNRFGCVKCPFADLTYLELAMSLPIGPTNIGVPDFI
ncbi:hypothetical protein NPIL_551891 [Nephila pilipes]|uniref:Uncharacterized protein n=1 Tax=Nephila pilipes TaxID=299642 RepID=A0A8X6TPG5_NEPPI|nr:hypothetical protein NPIL_551891 [Nephila pilipes]